MRFKIIIIIVSHFICNFKLLYHATISFTLNSYSHDMSDDEYWSRLGDVNTSVTWDRMREKEKERSLVADDLSWVELSKQASWVKRRVENNIRKYHHRIVIYRGKPDRHLMRTAHNQLNNRERRKRPDTTNTDGERWERLSVFLIYIMNGTSEKKFLLTLSLLQFVRRASWERNSLCS